MTNHQLVQAFLDGKEGTANNLTSVQENGELRLYSYAMLIATRNAPRRGAVVVNTVSAEKSPTQTTTRHIGMVRTALNMRPGDAIIFGKTF